jgi:hypothetical protein
MPSSWMLCRIVLVRTDASEEHSSCLVFACDLLRLQVTTNIVPSSPTLVTLMMEAILFSETSVLVRVSWRNIPEDGIIRPVTVLGIITQMVVPSVLRYFGTIIWDVSITCSSFFVF